MLHSTDAGEMSVISAYAQPYFLEDETDGYSKVDEDMEIYQVNTMRWYWIR